MTGESLRADGMISKTSRFTDIFADPPVIMRHQTREDLCGSEVSKEEL